MVCGSGKEAKKETRWADCGRFTLSFTFAKIRGETAITIRLASVALQLPVAPVMAVCEVPLRFGAVDGGRLARHAFVKFSQVLLDLIKGGLPFSQSELPPDSDQACGSNTCWSHVSPTTEDGHQPQSVVP